MAPRFENTARTTPLSTVNRPLGGIGRDRFDRGGGRVGAAAALSGRLTPVRGGRRLRGRWRSARLLARRRPAGRRNQPLIGREHDERKNDGEEKAAFHLLRDRIQTRAAERVAADSALEAQAIRPGARRK